MPKVLDRQFVSRRIGGDTVFQGHGEIDNPTLHADPSGSLQQARSASCTLVANRIPVRYSGTN